jgi:excisionase family DNA binding protein
MSKLLTTVEVGNLLNVSDELVRKWCREGKIKAIKLGKTWVIDEDNIAEHPPIGEWQGHHVRKTKKESINNIK